MEIVSRSEVQRIYIFWKRCNTSQSSKNSAVHCSPKNLKEGCLWQNCSGQIERDSTLILPVGSRVSPAVASHIVHRSNRLAHPSLLHPWHISPQGPQMHPYARDFFPELCENLRGWRHSAHDWPSRCSRDRSPGQCLEGCWGTEGDARDKASREKCESATKRKRERQE